MDRDAGDEMKRKKQTFGSSLRVLFGRLLSGRVRFPAHLIGKAITMDDGRRFEVFRDLKVSAEGDQDIEASLFKVRFRFRSFPAWANKRLSMMPIPFLIGFSGFREKIWAMNEETGEFQGIYQWDSFESAERYPESFIFKAMTKRAVPGSVSIEIQKETVLYEYMEGLLNQGVTS
jgi:hypothetical protein